MDAQQYLSRGIWLDNKIELDIEELERLRSMAQSISSMKEGTRVQSSPRGDAPFAAVVERILQQEKKINDEIEDYLIIKESIRNAIGAVPDYDGQLILRYRYCENRTWEDIAGRMYLSRKTVRKIHDKTLEYLDNHYIS